MKEVKPSKTLEKEQKKFKCCHQSREDESQEDRGSEESQNLQKTVRAENRPSYMPNRRSLETLRKQN